ncbi:uncharacterized protein CEXT_430631 [Caerostris extrusa]|uniref:Uncharacterized protein n=1 Tax=Caerostris extrusa TaxID=172846 RepID=A0AAV4VAZ1_CAEEX|nr:uncharacterized protein CEXT_430631 [Caerostris extrusa]
MTCQNVSDFEVFKEILDSSVFEVNTTFFITLSGNTVLPKGFSVDCLFLGSLLKISRPRGWKKEIPDIRAISSILSDLRLDNSRLTQLSGDNLKNLTEVRRLTFVNNSVEHVADDVFQVRPPLPPHISSFSFCLQVSKLPSALSCTFSSVPTVQTDLPPPLCRLHKLTFLLLVCCRDSLYSSLLIEKRA